MARNATLPVTQPQVAEDAVRQAHDRGSEMIVADKVGDTPMTIGEVARQFGMTLRALRFYEARRLITPQRCGAIRLYHRSDRERLTLILTGQRLGFTLTEIRDILDSPDGKGLHLTREQCVAQINLLEQQKHGIEIAIAELRRICTSFYKKLLEDTDSRRGMAGKN
jgi:DNA-binding transcriptional MerR regulator